MRKTAKERKIDKQTKKEIKTNPTNTFINNDSEAANFIKISLIVLILILIFSIITNIIIENRNNTGKKKSEIQYTNIIVGNILGRSEIDYYVLVEAKDDENISTYNNYISTYNEKENHLKIYKVDLTDGFNEPFVGEKANLLVTDIKDIVFTQTTLLHIVEGKISEATDNSEEISKTLKDLSA